MGKNLKKVHYGHGVWKKCQKMLILAINAPNHAITHMYTRDNFFSSKCSKK